MISESLRPAVNVEDVDHEKAGGGAEKTDASQTPALQDPKLTTLTVPVNPSGGRQRWAAAAFGNKPLPVDL